MTTANPYAAPGAADLGADSATYEPRVFSFSGRIGRLRYLAYGMAWNLLIGIAGSVLVGILSVAAGGSMGAITGATILMYLVLMVPLFAMAVRRFNDLDKSGWLSLLFFVPLVNFFVGLYLVFAPGTEGSNQYGPAPGPNSTLVVVAALILPIIAIVGILAAIALPAYQEYAMAAQAAAQ